MLHFWLERFSESKNFFLTLVIGLLGILIKLPRIQRRVLMGIGIGAAIMFHVVAWVNPNLASQWSDGLPYLEKVQQRETLHWQDFVPKLDVLTGRQNLWYRAVELWKDDRWFGVGPGVYKLNSGFARYYNTHNLFIQTLVDAGLIGLSILIVLLFRIARRIRDPVVFAIFFGALASQLFDYFLDYSIGFAIILAWLLSNPRLGVKDKNSEITA